MRVREFNRRAHPMSQLPRRLPRRRHSGMGVAIAILGGLFFVLGGAYVAIAWMLVGGITEIVNALARNPVPAGPIAWGIIKILFCELPVTVGVWLTIGLVAVLDR